VRLSPAMMVGDGLSMHMDGVVREETVPIMAAQHTSIFVVGDFCILYCSHNGQSREKEQRSTLPVQRGPCLFYAGVPSWMTDCRTYVGLKSPKSLRRNLDSIFTWKVHTRAASYGHVSRVSKLAALLDRSMVVAISNSILEDAQTG